MATATHGEGQQLKMEILDLIQNAADPFEIICRVAKRLGDDTGEPSFAEYVENQLRAVYGFALEHTKLISDEIKDVEARLAVMEKNRNSDEITPEEKTRIDFAIEHHRQNIQRLTAMLKRCEADGQSAILQKN